MKHYRFYFGITSGEDLESSFDCIHSIKYAISHDENARKNSGRKQLYKQLEVAERKQKKNTIRSNIKTIWMSGDKFWKKFNGDTKILESFYCKKFSNRYDAILAGFNVNSLGYSFELGYYTTSLLFWECYEYVHDIANFGYNYDEDDVSVFDWTEYYRQYLFSITCKNSKYITYEDLKLKNVQYENYNYDVSNSEDQPFDEYQSKKYRGLISARRRGEIQLNIINAIYSRMQYLARQNPNKLLQLKLRNNNGI